MEAYRLLEKGFGFRHSAENMASHKRHHTKDAHASRFAARPLPLPAWLILSRTEPQKSGQWALEHEVLSLNLFFLVVIPTLGS